MKNFKTIIKISWFFCHSLGLHATSPQKSNLFLAACASPVAAYEMHVNNVRAKLYSGGHLFNKGRNEGNYITPASVSTPVSAIYGAGVWMGGVDRAGSIKVSATTYSYDGSDFYTGPLDILGTTEATVCDQWDKIFTVKGNNIMQHIQNYKEALENQSVLSCKDISDDILYCQLKEIRILKKNMGGNYLTNLWPIILMRMMMAIMILVWVIIHYR